MKIIKDTIKKIKEKKGNLLDMYKFVKLQISYYQNNRVKFESELPPEFVITNHASEQMDSRFKWDEPTKKKVIVKAWNSKEKLKQQYYTRKKKLGYENCIYKMFSGYIFVFRTMYNRELGRAQKILITAINPKLIGK